MKRTEVIGLRTSSRAEMVDVTAEVESAALELAVQSGTLLVRSPHTTAAVTVNEGADPDVRSDIIAFLDTLVPRHGPYRHAEGNSDAHIKTMLVGPSELVVVEEGRLQLGTWQRIFFCEFDGPRSRRLLVSAL